MAEAVTTKAKDEVKDDVKQPDAKDLDMSKLKEIIDFIVKNVEKDFDVVGELLKKHSFNNILSELKKLLTIYKDKLTENTPWSPDYENLIQVNNVNEVVELVSNAIKEGKEIRIAGAQHSVPDAVFGDRKNKNIIHIKLEKDLRKVQLISENKEDETAIFRVGGGCNLGIDPSDPNSNINNSFNRIIDKLGYALSITGGVSHQTFGGFMSTSSAGGTLKYSFGDAVQSIQWVDGTGHVRVASRNDNDTDPFFAIGVSMGLFGIITHVTLKVQKKFLVKGIEETIEIADSFLVSDKTYGDLFANNDYAHGVWYPQPYVGRVLQYYASQAPSTDPIKEYHHPLQKGYLDIAAAFALYVVDELNNLDTPTSIKITSAILRVLAQLDKQEFTDHWYIALPNDDQAWVDTLIRVQFTEIWIDFDKRKEVLAALNKLFKDDPLAGGNFGVEMYAAKQSEFWMSQSHGHNVMRVDPYWWEYNPKGNINDFFTKYWNVLLSIETARLHWGKHFPAVGTQFKNYTMGPDYIKKSYPKFEEWLSLREKYDPKQIFVTKYWRDLFGIPNLQ